MNLTTEKSEQKSEFLCIMKSNESSSPAGSLQRISFEPPLFPEGLLTDLDFQLLNRRNICIWSTDLNINPEIRQRSACNYAETKNTAILKIKTLQSRNDRR